MEHVRATQTHSWVSGMVRHATNASICIVGCRAPKHALQRKPQEYPVTVKGHAQMVYASATKAIVIKHAISLATPVEPAVKDGTALTAPASARVELTTFVLGTERVIRAPMVTVLVTVPVVTLKRIVPRHALVEPPTPAPETENAILTPAHAFAASSFQEGIVRLRARASQMPYVRETASANGVRRKTEHVCVISATLHPIAARPVLVGQKDHAMGTVCAPLTLNACASEIWTRATGQVHSAPPV